MEKTAKNKDKTKTPRISKTIEQRLKQVEEQLSIENQKGLAVNLIKDMKASYNKLLCEAKHEDHFITKDNKRLRHLFDLIVALENMEDHVFKQHVNQFKNDFSKWIKNVFDHKDLANKITRLGTRKELKECLINEINFLFE